MELCTAAPSPAAVNEVQAIDHDSKTGDSRHDADPIDRSTGCRQAEEKPGRDDDTGSPRPRNRARESCLMSLPSRSPPNVFCSLSLSLSERTALPGERPPDGRTALVPKGGQAGIGPMLRAAYSAS